MMCVKIILVFLFFQNIDGYNILFVSDVPSPSHQIWNYELALGLLAKGHNVTMFGPSPRKGHGQKTYHAIDIEGLVETVQRDANPTHMLELNIFEKLMAFYDWNLLHCSYTLQSKSFQFLMDYPDDFKFDLIVFDAGGSPCLLPIVQRFNYPPTVAATAFLLPPYLSEMLGNEIQPSYMPFYLSKLDEEVTFFQRLQNHFWTRLDLLLRRVYVYKTIETLARQTFGEQMASFDLLQDHVSLVLCNLLQGYHHSQPLTANIIPVGGLHFNPTRKLPQDLQSIMDNATNGVILFSLGTNVKSASLKQDKRKVILEALGQLPQTVLFKFETELEGVPDNVIVRKWLPQSEILAHPNLRLFISHGGSLSVIEAAFFGVPVVGIPFFLDQMMNIQEMVNKKLAVRVEFLTMTSTILSSKINEVLNNSMYYDNAKKMSNILKDQPELAIDRAVFWLEYAIRHNGTHFLNPPSRHLPLLVSSSMDVYLFVLFVLVVLSVLSIKFVSLVRRTVWRRRISKKHKDD